jgi:hypothetical protein
VVVVFIDGATAYRPTTISSRQVHVVLVVKAVTLDSDPGQRYYRLAVVSKDGWCLSSSVSFPSVLLLYLLFSPCIVALSSVPPFLLFISHMFLFLVFYCYFAYILMKLQLQAFQSLVHHFHPTVYSRKEKSSRIFSMQSCSMRRKHPILHLSLVTNSLVRELLFSRMFPTPFRDDVVEDER